MIWGPIEKVGMCNPVYRRCTHLDSSFKFSIRPHIELKIVHAVHNNIIMLKKNNVTT